MVFLKRKDYFNASIVKYENVGMVVCPRCCHGWYSVWIHMMVMQMIEMDAMVLS